MILEGETSIVYKATVLGQPENGQRRFAKVRIGEVPF